MSRVPGAPSYWWLEVVQAVAIVGVLLVASACGVDSRTVEVSTDPGMDEITTEELDGTSEAAPSVTPSAAAPQQEALPSAGCVPSGLEICDGAMQDEDCDGLVNEGCDCITGRTASCGEALGALGVCADRRVTCNDGRWPFAECAALGPELCDARLEDEDCDGERNEAPPCETLTVMESSITHTCGITSSGRVLCWGQNADGQLGGGSTEPSETAVEVVGVAGAQSLAVSQVASCAVLPDRSARCWGRQTTQPFGEDDPRLGPARVTVFPEVLALATGGGRLCALLPDRTVSCTGRLASSPRTEAIAGLTDVQAIARGPGFCALVGDGTVHCWEDNQTVSAPVSGVAGAVELGGGRPLCARLASGQVSCWSDALMVFDTAFTFPGLENVVALSTGEGSACAVRADGSLACWGSVFPTPTDIDFGERAGVAEISLLSAQVFSLRLQSGAVFSGRSLMFEPGLLQLYIP